jgi:hypothetical protein
MHEIDLLHNPATVVERVPEHCGGLVEEEEKAAGEGPTAGSGAGR